MNHAKTDSRDFEEAKTAKISDHVFLTLLAIFVPVGSHLNEFFVHKFDEIRRSFDPDRPIPTNPVEFSGTAFAEFQLSISGLQLGRAEVLRGLRNFLSTDKPEHHSTDRLKERGVEKESGRHSTLQGRERSVFNQTNIGTVLRATLGRLLLDGAERVWAFPSATMPS